MEKGETVTITRHWKPIAKLVLVDAVRPIGEVFVEMDRIGATTRPGDPTMREMDEEDRR